MRESKKTHEDDSWEYGYYIDDGAEMPHLTWMKAKKINYWFHDDFKTIIKEHFKIPLNDEMVKQITKFEGDTEFLYDLESMCKNDWMELTDKQRNFMARLFLAHRDDVHFLFIKWFATKGLQAGKGTKEIEQRLKDIISKH